MSETFEYKENNSSLISEEERILTNAKGQEEQLEHVVRLIDQVKEGVNNFWCDKESGRESYKESIDEQRTTFTAGVCEAVRSDDWLSVIGSLGDGLSLFMQKFFGSDDPYAPDALLTSMMSDGLPETMVDYNEMDDDELDNYYDELSYETEHEYTGYKRLHYLWLKGRTKDEIDKRENKVFTDQYERVVAQLQPGDVVAFSNNGDLFNSVLTKRADNPLSHIGVIDGSTPPMLCHSTIGGDLINPVGGKKEPLGAYLDETKPRAIVVLRPQSHGKQIATKAHDLVSRGNVEYDRTGALVDLGQGGEGLETGYNCGEFVGEVLRSCMGIQVDEKKDALPGTYLAMPELEPVYMDYYTGSLST